MADRKFKAGDTVRLKSGGPLMTVDSLTTAAMGGTPMVSTTWLDQSGKRHYGAYLEAIVEAADGTPNIA